jgi:hypothetical protein
LIKKIEGILGVNITSTEHKAQCQMETTTLVLLDLVLLDLQLVSPNMTKYEGHASHYGCWLRGQGILAI